MVELYNKFKKNQLDIEDKVIIGKSQIGEQRNDLPEDLQSKLQGITNLDTNVHPDISNKSDPGFIYFKLLQEFNSKFCDEIKVENELIKKSKPMKN